MNISTIKSSAKPVDMRVPFMDPATGVWISAAGLHLKHGLHAGDNEQVMNLLGAMDAQEMGIALSEAGFGSPKGIDELNNESILEEMRYDLADACALKADGFQLSDMRRVNLTRRPLKAFAAKDLDVGIPEDYPGDIEAVKGIQTVLNVGKIAVSLLGDSPYEKRASLLFVAAQALGQNRQGFAFDGIPGKFAVPLSMPEIVNLNRHAVETVAVESVRSAITNWVDGKKTNEVSDWVPDSIRNVFRSSLSVGNVSAIVSAIDSGTIAKYAGSIGENAFGRLLLEQGIDVNAPTVQTLAERQGLKIVEPDTERGQYVGVVAGADHRACIIKYARDKSIEIPFNQLSEDTAKPRLGDTVRLRYKAGEMTVGVAERAANAVSR
jgi:hypothetical protein